MNMKAINPSFTIAHLVVTCDNIDAMKVVTDED